MRVTDSPEWADHAGMDSASMPYEEVAEMLTFDNNRQLWSPGVPGCTPTHPDPARLGGCRPITRRA
jgi:hypothetical protein